MKRLLLLADKPWLRWVVWTVYVLLWTTLLVIPFPESADWGLLEPTIVHKAIVAKTGHVCAYALMTVLTAWLRTGPLLRVLMLYFLMLHGAVTEWIQGNIASRTGLVSDVLLDHLGVLAGLALTWRWWTCK